MSLVLALLLYSAGPHAATLPNPVLEQRMLHLTEELRCLVCQNQTIADSHADLAMDLKKEVREKLAQGLSDQEIIDFMVQRYGDFVLYRPPVKGITWALWFGPFLLLAVGLAWLGIRLRQRSLQLPSDAVLPTDLAHAAALLSGQAHIAEKENQ
jgi:cytochrome c-type biogenesis protein CcmH